MCAARLCSGLVPEGGLGAAPGASLVCAMSDGVTVNVAITEPRRRRTGWFQEFATGKVSMDADLCDVTESLAVVRVVEP